MALSVFSLRPLLSLRLLAASGCVLAVAACSAASSGPPGPADDGQGPEQGADEPNGTPQGPVDISDGQPTLITEEGEEGSGAPLAPNLGGESVCDGKDDNGNGIIDDVDVGKDGLCDCIRIGFYGEVASDAGSANASFEAWLVERSGLVPIKRLSAREELTAEWLSDLQVLIVGGLRERVSGGDGFSADEIAAFDAWVRDQGGGVITLSGYTANIADARPTAELLGNTGLGYDTQSVSGPGVISEGGPPVWLTDILAPDHPTVEGVSQIGVFYGYPVTGDGTAILAGEGYTLAMAKQWGLGRVFAFADEWITQDATWSGLANGQADPCQQPCNEEANICRIAAEQCAQCEMQPCSDPKETDLLTCSKGCQGSCQSETERCATYSAECATCTADVSAREQATPRLWLNTIRWLTPDNECKVEIPPDVSIRVR